MFGQGVITLSYVRTIIAESQATPNSDVTRTSLAGSHNDNLIRQEDTDACIVSNGTF